MAARDFLAPETRKRTAQAIQEIERQTSAEIVVAVRDSSAGYHQADLVCGAVVGMATLLVLLFMDREVPIPVIPYLVLAGFLGGASVGALLPPLRRLLTRPSQRRAACLLAAKAAFIDLGVSRTRARTGVLVYVSLLERRVELVPDVGLRASDLAAAAAPIEAAVRAVDAGTFVEALGELAAPLALVCPHQDDDVNELPDEVGAS